MKRFVVAVAVAVCAGTEPSFAQVPDTTVVAVLSSPRQPARLDEEFVLGSGSRSGDYVFSSPRVYAGKSGSVFVVDIHGILGPSAVRHYDRNGHLIRTLGRNGQGPGEYSYIPGDVKELQDGRILLSDSRGILVFTATGMPSARWFAKASTFNMGSAILIDPAGFVGTFGSTDIPGRIYSQPYGTVPILYRFRFDGTVVDTVSPPEAAFPHPERLDRVIVPFVPRYLSAWSPLGYFVTANAASYAIDLRKPRPDAKDRLWRVGDPVLSIRRSIPPVPVLPAERSDWRQSLTMYMRSSLATSNWQWHGPDIPTVKPPMNDLFVDGNGRIWIRLSRPATLDTSVRIAVRPFGQEESMRVDAAKRWREPPVYDVLEETGLYLGQVVLPEGTSSIAAADDFVWLVVNDANDVGVVKRYRIRW